MTARYAHRVALMSADGRLVETGPPRQLMRDEGSRLFALINKVRAGAGALGENATAARFFVRNTWYRR